MTAEKRVVVLTGAGGFLGRNLGPHLEARGFAVARLSLRDPDWRAAMPRGAAALVHLAGLAHDLSGKASPEDYLRVNAGLALEAFEAFRAAGGRKFVFVSSVKAAADAPGPEPVIEASVPSPATPYGLSKLRAEEALAAANGERGDLYILRPAMIHGPGNKGNLNLLYRWIASGIPYPLGAFANARSFLSIDNFNFIVEALCTRELPPGIYNAADEEALSTLEVVELLGEALGKKPAVWKAPGSWVRGLARLGDALRLPFGTARLGKLTESYRVDNRKTVEALGERLPVSAREGLRRTFKAFAR